MKQAFVVGCYIAAGGGAGSLQRTCLRQFSRYAGNEQGVFSQIMGDPDAHELYNRLIFFVFRPGSPSYRSGPTC